MSETPQGQTQDDKKNANAQILSYIKQNPGVHFNDLVRALKFAPGTLQYHLTRMEKEKEIIVLRKEYNTLYFPRSLENPLDQKIMILLRQRIPRNLLLILLEHKIKSGQDLIKSLKITKSTLSYYIRRIEKLGILIIHIKGREKLFSLDRPERIARLLQEHKKSFGDELVDRFVDLWVRI